VGSGERYTTFVSKSDAGLSIGKACWRKVFGLSNWPWIDWQRERGGLIETARRMLSAFDLSLTAVDLEEIFDS
jgi:hypothetical protein